MTRRKTIHSPHLRVKWFILARCQQLSWIPEMVHLQLETEEVAENPGPVRFADCKKAEADVI